MGILTGMRHGFYKIPQKFLCRIYKVEVQPGAKPFTLKRISLSDRFLFIRLCDLTFLEMKEKKIITQHATPPWSLMVSGVVCVVTL